MAPFISGKNRGLERARLCERLWTHLVPWLEAKHRAAEALQLLERRVRGLAGVLGEKRRGTPGIGGVGGDHPYCFGGEGRKTYSVPPSFRLEGLGRVSDLCGQKVMIELDHESREGSVVVAAVITLHGRIDPQRACIAVQRKLRLPAADVSMAAAWLEFL